MDWFLLLLGRRLSGLRVFFGGSLLLDLSERDSQLLLLALRGRSLVNLVSFRDFLKLFGVVYLPA